MSPSGLGRDELGDPKRCCCGVEAVSPTAVKIHVRFDIVIELHLDYHLPDDPTDNHLRDAIRRCLERCAKKLQDSANVDAILSAQSLSNHEDGNSPAKAADSVLSAVLLGCRKRAGA